MLRSPVIMTDYTCVYCGKWTDQQPVWTKPMILPPDPEVGADAEFIPGYMAFSHPKCNALAMMDFEDRMKKLGLDISAAVDEAVRKARSAYKGKTEKELI